MTEKLFDTLKYDIVPIVFGSADYKSFLPSYSFLDSAQYTPKQLAKHLNHIASDDEKYKLYFKWKERYYVKSDLDVNFDVLCKICEKLNVPSIYPGHSTDEIIDWWFRKGNCTSWKLHS